MTPYTISTANDDRNKKGEQMISFPHDNREKEAVEQANLYDKLEGKPPHILTDKMDDNVYIIQSKDEADAYEKVLGDSISRYNAGQKRKDRHTSVEKEMEKIKSDKRELCYEMIVQVGNRDCRPSDKTCIAILEQYVEEWQKKFPNMKIVNAVIHVDELGGPHLHLIYIPVKTKEGQLALQEAKYKEAHEGSLEGFKATRWQGTDVQNSLSGALEEMGYSNDKTVTIETEKGELITKHDYKNGALTQWQADFNGLLEEICTDKKYGFNLKITHPLAGEDVCHQETSDFKHDQKIRQELKEEIDNLRLDKFDLENENKELKEDRDRYKAEAEEARKEAKEAREEAEAEKAQVETLKAENEALTQWKEDTCAEIDDTNNKIKELFAELGEPLPPPVPLREAFNQKETENQNTTIDEVNNALSYIQKAESILREKVKTLIKIQNELLPKAKELWEKLQQILGKHKETSRRSRVINQSIYEAAEKYEQELAVVGKQELEKLPLSALKQVEKATESWVQNTQELVEEFDFELEL